ncbi:hypothetical protein M408DRAFT_331610 [Serendipita vermifera MAFF 305830]|uniref:Uncharacterized protein n=1 Tax=Serendipita vermifera MAFF 305830 TaxID=933852 RepID=A0A0C2X674_SERVB|nr:hypothetical protein M408DRAFT_331610 [Serendipita vermifera MAFF 305830]
MFSIAVRMPYVSKVPETAQSVDGQEFIEKPLLVGTLEAAHAFALDFHLVVRKPGFCPFCVYDMSLPWHRRMKQFSLPTIFRDHLVTHILSLSDDETYKCPDPCCSPSQYGPQELGSHLVLVHLLPVYGNVQAPHKLVNWGAPALRTSFWVREGFKNAKKAEKVKKKAQNTADSECSDSVAESEEELETEDEMSSVVTDE